MSQFWAECVFRLALWFGLGSQLSTSISYLLVGMAKACRLPVASMPPTAAICTTRVDCRRKVRRERKFSDINITTDPQAATETNRADSSQVCKSRPVFFCNCKLNQTDGLKRFVYRAAACSRPLFLAGWLIPGCAFAKPV